jgi:hypothetical protein
MKQNSEIRKAASPRNAASDKKDELETGDPEKSTEC